MNFTIGTTFSAFKKDFYGKTRDFSLYDCDGINIVKIVLDGLKVNYATKGQFRVTFFYQCGAWNLIRALQRMRASKQVPPAHPDAKVLIADLSGRSESNNSDQPQSYYFEKLKNELITGSYVHVIENTRTGNYPSQVDLRRYQHLQFAKADDADKKLRRSLLGAYSRLVRSALFDKDELLNIRIAIQVFFSQYKIWKELLKKLPAVKTAIVEQHYHHEGLILALHQRGIECIEAQHGLIAESDIFYVFPRELAAVRSRALFPDKILVYGSYWKDVLKRGSEFDPAAIIVTGDFRIKAKATPTDPGNDLRQFIADSKIVLITTQTFMHVFYAEYTAWLAELVSAKHRNWKIVVKLHPNEKPEDYAGLAKYSHVFVTNANLDQLFRQSAIHISVYSTTLYDALSYDLLNLSLSHPGFSDYTAQIVSDRIALPINQGEDPVERLTSGARAGLRSPDEISGDFNILKKNFRDLLPDKLCA